MAVRLRLKRMGAKGRPFYRIVAADSRSPRDGRFIETVGTYDPLQQPAVVKVKRDRLEHWISVGALPTDSVQQVLRSAGLVDEKGKVLPEGSEAPTRNEAPAEAEAEAEPVAAE
jgi:small subunit ribosomal protein S16